MSRLFVANVKLVKGERALWRVFWVIFAQDTDVTSFDITSLLCRRPRPAKKDVRENVINAAGVRARCETKRPERLFKRFQTAVGLQ